MGSALPADCCSDISHKGEEPMIEAFFMGPCSIRSCTAVAASLSKDEAIAICSPPAGGLAAWSLGPGGSRRLWCPQPDNLIGEDICCLSLPAPCEEELGAGWPLGGEQLRGLGRAARLCCAGTTSGEALLLSFDQSYKELKVAASWDAHGSAPSGGQRHSGVSSVALDGSSIVTGGADSNACTWNCADAGGDNDMHVTEAGRWFGAHGGAVTAVAAASAERITVTAGEDGKVRLWTPTADEILPAHRSEGGVGATPRISRSAITDIALDVKHCRVCTAAEDGILRMWDTSAGRPTRRFGRKVAPIGNLRAAHGLRSVAFDVAELPTRLASGAADGTWQLWDVRQTQEVPIVQNITSSGAMVASVSVLGDRLLTAAVDGRVDLWDLRCVRSSPRLAPAGCAGNPDTVCSVSLVDP